MAEEEKHQQQQQSLIQPAPKVPRLSSDAAGVVTMASPSPLMLGLGLGIGAAGAGSYRPAFTFMQLQELEHQALIYKYMVAGVPVPLHLVLPIWKSVAGSTYGAHHYPSFMGYGSVCLDYRNSMEPEPGRCRRTDGKKWRCSRDVVPDQKYCERHMHRGRNRSRKPVEAGGAGVNNGGITSATTTTAATTTTSITTSTVQAQAQASNNSNMNSSNNNNNSSTNLSIAIPIAGGGLQLMPTATTSSGGGSSSTSSNNVSPPRLGFSPTSVLQATGAACKAGPA